MKIEKCRKCKHYDNFFGACKLYQKEVYLDEGEFDIRLCRISEITEFECEFEQRK